MMPSKAVSAILPSVGRAAVKDEKPVPSEGIRTKHFFLGDREPNLASYRPVQIGGIPSRLHNPG
jgi:hypothetical protein